MTMTNERRNFLKTVSAAAASTAVLAGTQALAQGNPQAAAKAMPYQAKPLAGGRPVLVLDMYEHAYHMDYGAAAARSYRRKLVTAGIGKAAYRGGA